MNKTASSSDESQMHLEAMLYLLDDPALDRQAFEARLLNDPQLNEILANSVETFHGLRSTKFDPSSVDAIQVPVRNSHESIARQRLYFPALAASLLLACVLSWRVIDLISTDKSNSASPVSIGSVVLAWGDLQLESEDPMLSQESLDGELASSSNETDSFAESEVPDWLVLAATDISDSKDSGDGKVFIQ